MNDRTCLLDCPSNFYKNDSLQECSICHSSCLECYGKYFYLQKSNLQGNSDSTSCTDCPSLKVLDPLSLNPERGVCQAQCSSNQYSDPSKICRPCDSSCLTCQASGSSSCLSCILNKVLHMNQCLDSCPSGFFNSGGTCMNCGAGCLSCSSSSICTQCSSTTFLIPGGCVSSCPVTNSPNNSLRICCHTEC